MNKQCIFKVFLSDNLHTFHYPDAFDKISTYNNKSPNGVATKFISTYEDFTRLINHLRYDKGMFYANLNRQYYSAGQN